MANEYVLYFDLGDDIKNPDDLRDTRIALTKLLCKQRFRYLFDTGKALAVFAYEDEARWLLFIKLIKSFASQNRINGVEVYRRSKTDLDCCLEPIG